MTQIKHQLSKMGGGVTAVLVCTLAISNPAFALQGISVTSTSGVGNGDFNIGYRFSVGAQDITVTDLGYIDLGSDGLVASNDVGLYDDIGNLLSQGTVLSGTDSPLIGFFRYAPITPITLTSGQIYRVAGSFRQGFDTYTGVGTGFNVDPAINYLDTVFAFGSTLAFPSRTNSDIEPI